jgi:hypothetical protein
MADDFDSMMAARAARKAEAADKRKETRDAQIVKLNDIELEHGDDNVAALWAGDALVVMRRPTQSHFTYFQDMSGAGGDEAEKAQRIRRALETLARQCLLHPDEVAFRDLCKIHVGLAVDAGNAARKLGDDAEVVATGKS